MFQSYAPKDVVVSFNGIPITGFAEGTMITLKRSGDVIKKKVGAQGDVCLTMSADRTGEIEMTLMGTAPANGILALALNAQELLRVPSVGVLLVSDPSGQQLAIAKNAFFIGFPDIEMADEDTSKTWRFGCENLAYGTAVGFVPQTL
jgi:hypothetical protein